MTLLQSVRDGVRVDWLAVWITSLRWLSALAAICGFTCAALAAIDDHWDKGAFFVCAGIANMQVLEWTRRCSLNGRE